VSSKKKMRKLCASLRLCYAMFLVPISFIESAVSFLWILLAHFWSYLFGSLLDDVVAFYFVVS